MFAALLDRLRRKAAPFAATPVRRAPPVAPVAPVPRRDPAAAALPPCTGAGAQRPLVSAQGALATLPASWLAPAALDAHWAPGMHLLLRADAMFDDPAAIAMLVSRLRRAGVRVGWAAPSTPSTPASAPMPPMPVAAGRPDFMPLPPPAGALAWPQAVEAAALRWPGVPLLLLDLPSIEVMESVLGPTVLWAACNIAGCPEPVRAQAMSSSTA